MCFNLKDKVVLVTGASRGIGYDIAYTFAKEKAKVVITGTKKNSIEEVAQKIKNECNTEVLAFEHNVADSTSSALVCSSTIEKFSTIDILVNNAGVTNDKLMLQMTDSDFHNVIDINLSGTFYMSREVVKIMSKNRRGKIINVSSVVGKNGNAAQVNYAASKAGIIGLTKSMAKEFARRNICVNAIAPGFIETDMTKVLSEDVVNKIKTAIPLNRLGSVRDVSNLVLFLASSFSDYITGEVIAVDGGMSM